MSATKQMQMQMVHRLAAIVPGIHDDPVPILQPLFAGDLGRGRHQMTHQCSIFHQRLRSGTNMLLRNNKQVGGRLRINVGEANAEFVFVHTVSRNGSGDDLAEQAVRRRRSAQLIFHSPKYFGCCPGAQGL